MQTNQLIRIYLMSALFVLKHILNAYALTKVFSFLKFAIYLEETITGKQENSTKEHTFSSYIE